MKPNAKRHAFDLPHATRDTHATPDDDAGQAGGDDASAGAVRWFVAGLILAAAVTLSVMLGSSWVSGHRAGHEPRPLMPMWFLSVGHAADAGPATAPATGPATRRAGPRSALSPDVLKSGVVTDAVASAAADAARGTVRLVLNGRDGPLGVAVSEDGLILSKASELADPTSTIEVRVADGRKATAVVRAVAREHDLALLHAPLTGVEPVTFDVAAADELEAGLWLLSPGTRAGVVVGNVSVTGPRRIPGSGGGILGIGMGPPRAGVPIVRVEPASPAARAGVRAGDLVEQVNGRPVGTMQDLVRLLRDARPGAPSGGQDTLRLTLARDGTSRDVDVPPPDGRPLGLVLATEVSGVTIQSVSPASGAQAAGLQAGDVILALNDEPTPTAPAVQQVVRQLHPGDTVRVIYLRAGEELEVDATLGYRQFRNLRSQAQNQMGTTLSLRAVDFPEVLQHDTVLNADEMGGPLVDLWGRVVGMNIARAGRVETYALPSALIERVLPELLAGLRDDSPAEALTEDGLPRPDAPLQDD